MQQVCRLPIRTALEVLRSTEPQDSWTGRPISFQIATNAEPQKGRMECEGNFVTFYLPSAWNINLTKLWIARGNGAESLLLNAGDGGQVEIHQEVLRYYGANWSEAFLIFDLTLEEA